MKRKVSLWTEHTHTIQQCIFPQTLHPMWLQHMLWPVSGNIGRSFLRLMYFKQRFKNYQSDIPLLSSPWIDLTELKIKKLIWTSWIFECNSTCEVSKLLVTQGKNLICWQRLATQPECVPSSPIHPQFLCRSFWVFAVQNSSHPWIQYRNLYFLLN